MINAKKIEKLARFFATNPFQIYGLFARNRIGIRGTAFRKKFSSIDAVVSNHFMTYSDETHPCRDSLKMALDLLGGRAARILETGSSAWGANSSLLFDSYVNSFGGEFHSCDIRLNPIINLVGICTQNSYFYCDDSVRFLKKIQKNASLIYLDSWDVNWLDPLPSALHGLNEFMTIYPYISPGTLLLIDDTPKDAYAMSKVHPNNLVLFEKFQRSYGFAPGKGALVLNYLKQFSIGKLIHHDYQLLWRM
jgi:hypothetical protein